MAKHQNPYKGAPRLGGDAPGEPADSPVAGGVAGFGGGPTLNGVMNRGEKAVSPDPSSTIFPAPYGGGNPFEVRPNAKPASGSGDGTGHGATDGNAVP